MDQQQEKEEVSITVDNHWDILLPEIQQHIWNFKTRLEKQEKARWKKVMKEIRQYDQLRKRWRLGFIRVSRHQYELRVRQEIWGCYQHEYYGEYEKYLGETFEEALECVDDERVGIQYGYYLA